MLVSSVRLEQFYDFAQIARGDADKTCSHRRSFLLNPCLCPLYDVRVFVESDRTSTLQTAIDRGVGEWETEWRELFLPSADLYMLTEPQNRADLLVAGRGTS